MSRYLLTWFSALINSFTIILFFSSKELNEGKTVCIKTRKFGTKLITTEYPPIYSLSEVMKKVKSDKEKFRTYHGLDYLGLLNPFIQKFKQESKRSKRKANGQQKECCRQLLKVE